MKGHYRWDEKAKRYVVCIYWHGKKEMFYRYNGEPIWHEKTADKMLSKIRCEIDDGTFDPRAYRPQSPLTLKAYSEAWLKASTACDNTKRVHRSALKKALDAWGDIDIRHITFSRISALYCDATGSQKWRNAPLIALKAMLHFAVKDGVLKQVPPFPKLEAGQRQPVEYLTYADQRKVLLCVDDRHRAVFEFGMEFGLRIGEVRAIQKDCITEDHVIIRRSFSQFELRETTKTYRVRHLPLTTRAREILKTAPPSFSEFVFTHDGRRPYYESGMRKIWKEACVQAGIKIGQKNAIRHSLGCQLLDEGVDLEMVRDIYGHSTTDMTRNYTHRAPRRMLDVLEKRGEVVAFTTRVPPEKKSQNSK